MKILLITISSIILLSSCSVYKNERSTYFPGTEPLKRSDYYTLSDASVEETVTTKFGFLHSTQTGEEYKRGYIGNIKREGGSILVGNFRINVASILLSAAFSVGSAFLITEWSGTVNNTFSKRYGENRIPFKYSLVPGIAMGLMLNNLFSSTPTKRAIDLVNYNFLDKYEADYLLNPRYEIREKSSLFTKSATVKLTSKSIKIKTERKFND
jgi:hypothetical protein